ncbi:glycosyltransferase [Polynucleobacter sinensis]|uniref:glycosyltransferase n=1 Tax=Polynucleobacter sinensis TaxID=1743157 RepID=UPI000782401D|nr:glycosyltransferase [Polynucleobacter sinensis]
MSNDLKPHILFLPSFYIDPDRPVLGIFFREQALALQKVGCQVSVAYVEARRIGVFRLKHIIENHGQISVENEEGIPTMRLHGWNTLTQTFVGGLIWAVLTKILVNQYIKRYGRPDIIHAHNAYWAGYAGYLVWRMVKIPYVLTEHSSKFLLQDFRGQPKWFCRVAYQNASRVLAVSNAERGAIARYVAEEKCDVVPNCVDTEFFTFPPVQAKSDNFVFLAIAHFSSNKGFDVLLRAFAQKFKGDKRTYLRIGGDGSIRNQLVSLCCELQIQSQVQFLGALSKQEVRIAMWSANAFISSSFHETFGVVLIEAMATGLPVIATKSGGPNDIVTNKVGMLVEVGDVSALANSMQNLRYDNHFDREIIRNEIISKYAPPVFAKKVVNVYKGILEKY